MVTGVFVIVTDHLKLLGSVQTLVGWGAVVVLAAGLQQLFANLPIIVPTCLRLCCLCDVCGCVGVGV